jgi:membrane associated rhomboid family serine protease
MVMRRWLERRQAPATYALVLCLVGIQCLVEFQSHEIWYRMGGLNRETFVATKSLTLFSYGFLHGGWWHMLSNALMIVFLGARIESWWGARKMLVIYFGGLLAGGIMHLLLSVDQQGLLVGSSAGAMSLLLAVTTSDPDARFFPIRLRARNVGYGVIIASALLMVLHPERKIPALAEAGQSLQSMLGQGVYRIGHACHAGGALFGLLYVKWSLWTMGRKKRK